MSRNCKDCRRCGKAYRKSVRKYVWCHSRQKLVNSELAHKCNGFSRVAEKTE